MPCHRVVRAAAPPRRSSSATSWSITAFTRSSSAPFTAFGALPLGPVLALLRHGLLHQLVAVLLVWQVPVSCQRLPPPAALGWRLGDALDAPLEAQPQLANLGAPHRPLSQSNACDVRFLGCADTRNRNCAFLCVRAWLHFTTIAIQGGGLFAKKPNPDAYHVARANTLSPVSYCSQHAYYDRARN